MNFSKNNTSIGYFFGTILVLDMNNNFIRILACWGHYICM
jgi:hypothetical protein